MYFDAAAFCGHWPFYHLRDGDLQQVLERMKKEGIEGGFLSSLDGMFYNDPWEADEKLVQALAGTNWRVAMCVNPTMPWAQQLLRQGKEAGVGAVRLYPCIHGYDEDDARAVALCRLAGELGLSVIVTFRVEDVRMSYLLQQKDPDMKRIRGLIAQCADTEFILSNCLIHQVEELMPLPQGKVWFDTAGFKGDFYLETQQQIAPNRILFGSFTPLQSLSSALLCIPEETKNQIMRENAKNFCK